MKTKQIVIGNSDYTREEILNGENGFGCSGQKFIDTILFYEKEGYLVEFKKPFWRKLFRLGYKVTATKII